MKRLLIIEGLPGSGKSYLIEKLKKDFPDIPFLKHTRPQTRRKILANNNPILNKKLFFEILEDCRYLKEKLYRIRDHIVIVERFVISTLITMSLSRSLLHPNIFEVVRFNYQNVLDCIPFGDIFCINIQYNKKSLKGLLLNRAEIYYNAWGKYLPGALDAEKNALRIADRILRMDVKNLKRKSAYKAAVKFLKGGK